MTSDEAHEILMGTAVGVVMRPEARDTLNRWLRLVYDSEDESIAIYREILPYPVLPFMLINVYQTIALFNLCVTFGDVRIPAHRQIQQELMKAIAPFREVQKVLIEAHSDVDVTDQIRCMQKLVESDPTKTN